MRLKGILVSAAGITPCQSDILFALMDRYYANLRREIFEADLAQKQWVILLLDQQTEAIVGFSTQAIWDIPVGNRTVQALFSGDTIVDRSHWGDPTLAHVWGQLALTLIDHNPGGELYWFLISKGYKTYRFLPLFFREFYPRLDCVTPPWAKEVVDALAFSHFPGTYDPAKGVVRGGPSKDRLRPGVADLTSERLNDSHIRFFKECNPGHQLGDELCCLAPLTRANFTRAAWRVIGQESATREVAFS